MTISLKHLKTSTVPDGGDPSLIQPSDWNQEHTLSCSTNKLIGRSTAGTGSAEEISIGSGLSLSGGTLTSTGSGGTVTSVSGTGTVSGLSLSGTVTGSGSLTLGGALDLSAPPAIGGTTPAAGTFTTLTGNSTSSFGAGSANYLQVAGAATTKTPIESATGSDTNIALAFVSKGTGGIDLATGSAGVNISNGGTVTAITRTATGDTYTSAPSVAITAPTTPNGVQAVATCTLRPSTATIVSGGTGYTVGDTLTISGGTFTSAATFTVSTVSSGVITAVSATSGGVYTVVPSNPVSVTGGTGSGATFNITGWGINAAFTITNAGSGYLEQPTVSFSGGGGSGAAAYATVGSGTKVQSLGSTMSFYTAGGEVLRVTDGAGSTGYWNVGYNGTNPALRASTSNNAQIHTIGTTAVLLGTNGGTTQLSVSHTASAVNYVQVTGGASGSPADVTLSAQGSSADVNVSIVPRGTNGYVKFGTYVAGAPAATGYIYIRDSGGTLRKVLVG